MPIKPNKPAGAFAFGCLSLLSPRLLIIILVLAGDYIGNAFESQLWPFLGFLFMPITTLATAVVRHEMAADHLRLASYGIIALGIILDFGLIGGGSWGLRPTRPRPGQP